LPKAADFEVPIGFDISEADSKRRKVLLPGAGSVAFVADKTEQQLAKYKEAGYKVKNLERMGGISGTMVRDLIAQGNLGELQQVLSPGVYELISNNIGRIQNRANILPSLIEQVQKSQAVKLADVEKQIKSVGISRIDQKKMGDPEYAAKAEALLELRDLRDKIKSSGSFEPYRLLDKLAADQPEKYGLDLTIPQTVDPKPIRTVGQSQKASLGGLIKQFAEGGETEAPKSRAEIFKVLSRDEAARAAGIDIFRAYDVMGIRREPTSEENRWITAIREAYITKVNRRKGAKKGEETRLTNRGLYFAAAGMFGKPFPEDIYDVETKDGETKRAKLVSGVMDQDLANTLDNMFREDVDTLTSKAADTAVSAHIVSRLKSGKEASLDFDKTLAVGADDLVTLEDFRDPDKVSEQLKKARLTILGSTLADLVKQHPEILPNLKVVTARANKITPLLKDWLASQGLPITQIVGVGGDDQIVDPGDIPALKAAKLTSGSLFVDDDPKNIAAALNSGKDIETYRYGSGTDISNINTESSIQGGLLEKVVNKLGGPGAVKGLGFDFPTGLGSAARYFNVPDNIPTDLKRTISGSKTIKDNIATYLKAMNFNSGGLVQSFEEGSLDGVKNRSTKGKKRGAYGGRGFKLLTSKEYKLFAEKAYREVGPYGGPDWSSSSGVPLPKVLAEYADSVAKYVFETGGAGISIGKFLTKIPDDIEPDALEALKPDLIRQHDGWYSEIEEILPFGKSKPKSSTVSMKEARALAAAETEKGNRFYTQAEESIAAFKKSGILAPFDPSISSYIQSSFPGYISDLESHLKSETDPDEKASIQRKLKKAQVGWPDYQNLLKGTPVPNPGRVTGLSETLNALLESYGSPVSLREIDNIISALGSKLMKKRFGGAIQSFMAGGVADRPRKARSSNIEFGSGEYAFPKRISNAYVKEMTKLLEDQQIERAFETYPRNERLLVDDSKVSEMVQRPFNRENLIASFKDKIGRNLVFERMGQFAQFVGLPPEDFLSAIPTQLDFGGPNPSGAVALFSNDPSGPNTRGLEGVDLTPYGFSEKDKQDLYGYSKLIEEKNKEITKVIKTPITTYDDGSFSYDRELAKKLYEELDILKSKQREKIDLNNIAIKAAKADRLNTAKGSGRGSISLMSNPFNIHERRKNDVLYHEMTHQLINSLRTKNSQSFETYKARVSSLFEGDNDDVALAYDALVGSKRSGYNSADVAYGRSYKISGLDSLIRDSNK